MRPAALVALAAADLGLTLFGFSHGASEAMPFGAYAWATAGALGLVLIKVVSVTVSLIILRWMPRYAQPYAWAMVLGLSALPVGWNIGVLAATLS